MAEITKPVYNPFTGKLDLITAISTNTITPGGGIAVSCTGGVCTVSASGSAASNLQITESGVEVSSPTSSINFYGGDFDLHAIGSTSTIHLNPDTTNYIHNTSILQSGSTFYVSSGTVNGFLNVYGSDPEFWIASDNTPRGSLKMIPSSTGAGIHDFYFQLYNASKAGIGNKFHFTGPLGNNEAFTIDVATPSFRASSGTVTGQFIAGTVLASGLASGKCVETGTGGLLTVTGSACGSGSATLISSGVAFGSSANVVTQDTMTFRWNNTERSLNINVGTEADGGYPGVIAYANANGNAAFQVSGTGSYGSFELVPTGGDAFSGALAGDYQINSAQDIYFRPGYPTGSAVLTLTDSNTATLNADVTVTASLTAVNVTASSTSYIAGSTFTFKDKGLLQIKQINWFDGSVQTSSPTAGGAGSDTKPPINYNLDGGGVVLSSAVTSLQAFYEVPYAITITSVTLSCDVATSTITISVSSATVAAFTAGTTPTSICASACPSLASQRREGDGTLTGWAKTYAAGDYLFFDLATAAPEAAKRCLLQLWVN